MPIQLGGLHLTIDLNPDLYKIFCKKTEIIQVCHEFTSKLTPDINNLTTDDSINLSHSQDNNNNNNNNNTQLMIINDYINDPMKTFA